MNLQRRTLIIVIIFSTCFSLKAQKDPNEKFYYKDTLFEFMGCKIEVTKSVANRESFKSAVTINNTTDQFLIVNPWEVFGNITGSSDKYSATSKREIIIPPKYSKRVTVKFVGRDFRVPSLTVDFTKMKITEKVESVYDLGTVDINKENYKAVGPIKWKMVEKDIKKGRPDCRIETELEYTGSKFLGIFYNNILLQTKDGGNYINASKRTGDFHYDNSKPLKRINLIFPVESEKLDKNNNPVLIFNDVFKEYSLATIAGFKYTLRAGSLEDYKGNKGDDKDIEEMD